ncbi:MAG: SnoaL-like domain-containing protein [Rhodothermaceae bacterium]|nr:SnoaL-like domain-containing protein [Rhodothermaceae bacterium]
MARTRFLFSFVLLLLTNPLQAQSPEAHKAIILAFNEAVNDRAFDRLSALVRADFVRHGPAPAGAQVRSRDAFIAYLQSNHVVFPDERVEMHRLVAEGEYVGFWATYHGTQREPMPTPMGVLPATGRPAEMPFSGLFRLEDGQIAELWVTWDNLGILSQLGHFPPGDKPADAEAADAEAARAELLAADRAWAAAAAAGDIERVTFFWADDAVNYFPGAPVAEGIGAIRALVQRNRSMPGFSLSWEPERVVVARSGEIGYTTGPFTLSRRNPEGALVTRRGHYVCLWERQADGSWKCVVESSVFGPDSEPSQN